MPIQPEAEAPDLRTYLIRRALCALNPDPEHAEGVAGVIRTMSRGLPPEGFQLLVESIERAAGDVNHRLMLERYGSVTRRG